MIIIFLCRVQFIPNFVHTIFILVSHIPGDTCRFRNANINHLCVKVSGGENVPVIPAHAQPVILRIWQEAHVTILNKMPLFNTLRSEQNGSHVADDTFNCISSNSYFDQNITDGRSSLSVLQQGSIRWSNCQAPNICQVRMVIVVVWFLLLYILFHISW